MAAPSSEITQAFRLVRHVAAVSPPVLEGVAGGTIAAGHIVANSGGTVIKAVGATSPAEILGIAINAATSGQKVQYVMAIPGVILEAILSGSTTANTAYATATHMFAQFGLDVDGGNTRQYVDYDDTTNSVFVVVGVDPAVVSGTTTFAKVYVTFLSGSSTNPRSAFAG